MDVDIRGIESNEEGRGKDILTETFQDDPTLAWCFFADRSGYRDRLRAYIDAGHQWHKSAGQPIVGAFANDQMVGVMYAMTPDVQTTPEDVAQLEREMLEGCGQEAVGRFSAYNQSVSESSPDGPHHVLALVGILEPWRRQGIASRLVDWLHAACDQHPTSEGVILDTGSTSNVAFYERRGYRQIGEILQPSPTPSSETEVAPHSGTWYVLMRPKAPRV